MRDPHVECLYFEVASGRALISYEDPEPLAFSNEIGDFSTQGETLTVRTVEHFTDADSARQMVEPFLRSWEIATDLAQNYGQIRFTYKNALVVDRDPPKPGESTVADMRASGTLTISGNATLSLSCRKYPDPPKGFAATTDVQIAHMRWLQCMEGRESLQSMGYFLLTLIERLEGNRSDASTALKVSMQVLSNLGRLTSEHGDAETSRKAPRDGKFIELTDHDRAWVESAVKRLIQRLGEHAAGVGLEDITLSDFPSLAD